jgi:hypothetical protein
MIDTGASQLLLPRSNVRCSAPVGPAAIDGAPTRLQSAPGLSLVAVAIRAGRRDALLRYLITVLSHGLERIQSP